MTNGKISLSINSDDKVDVDFNRGSKAKVHGDSWFNKIDHPNAFGERLYQARRKNCFTQKTLGTDLGVTQTAIAEWESGRSHPKLERIETIAEILDTTPQYLLTGEEPGHG